MNIRAKLVGGPEDGEAIYTPFNDYEVYEMIPPNTIKEYLIGSLINPLRGHISTHHYENSGLTDQEEYFIFIYLGETIVDVK